MQVHGPQKRREPVWHNDRNGKNRRKWYEVHGAEDGGQRTSQAAGVTEWTGLAGSEPDHSGVQRPVHPRDMAHVRRHAEPTEQVTHRQRLQLQLRAQLQQSTL